MHIAHAKKTQRFKKLRLYDTIFHPDLLAELERCRIPEHLTAKFLQQIHVADTYYPDSKLHGYAFVNDAGGYEVRFPENERLPLSSLLPHSPTTFKRSPSKKLLVFENCWDFLCWLTMQDLREPEHNTVVLNSHDFCEEITEQIISLKEQIDTVLLFNSFSDVGRRVKRYMDGSLTEARFTFRSMDGLYRGYRDLSHYWRSDHYARKINIRKDSSIRDVMNSIIHKD